MKQIILCVLPVLILLSCNSNTNNTEDSKSTVNNIDELIKNAENGNVEAQIEVGMLYYNGTDYVKKDCAEASHWFRMAAEQGSAEGQYRLGRMYDYGEGEEKNEEMALLLYRRAASQGHPYAQKALGIFYKEDLE
ncbi:MAG: sel1 repeat family protein [Bacteroidales bacterium]|nr:sel1 repeat family protein [Bacteroidales bacterium]